MKIVRMKIAAMLTLSVLSIAMFAQLSIQSCAARRDKAEQMQRWLSGTSLEHDPTGETSDSVPIATRPSR